MTAGPDNEGTGRAGDDAHPDLETLAEMQEGLLERDDERRVRRHVASCGECADALAGLDATRGLLAGLPPVAMPDDVAARLDEALAEAPAAGVTTVVPTAGRTPWWRSGTFAGSAAAAAVVLLVAGVIAGALRSSHHSNNNLSSSTAGSASPAASGARTFSTTESDRNYTATTLASSLPSLLGAAAPAPSASANARPDKAAVGGTAASGSGRAPLTAFDALKQPQKLLDCVAALTGRPAGAVVPLAADLATFQGKPAAVIVLPSANRPALVDVWVVGPGCSAADQQFIYFLRAARPS